MKHATRQQVGPIVLVLFALAAGVGIWLSPKPITSADYAAWAQAIGTVGAVGAALALAELQVWRQRRERAAVARAILIKLTLDLLAILGGAATDCRAKAFGPGHLDRLDRDLEAALASGNSVSTALYFDPTNWGIFTTLADKTRALRRTFPQMEALIRRKGRLPVYQFDPEVADFRRLIQMIEDTGLIRGNRPIKTLRSPPFADESPEGIRREVDDAADRVAFASD